MNAAALPILPVRGIDEDAIASTSARAVDRARLCQAAGAERDARHAAILAGDLAAREGQDVCDNPFVRSGPDALIQHWLNGFHSVPIFQRKRKVGRLMAKRPPETVQFAVEKYEGRVAVVLTGDIIAKGRKTGSGRELYLMEPEFALAHARAIVATVNELRAAKDGSGR